MALIVADRVYETSTTTGTGAYTLAGVKGTTYQAFSAVCVNADTLYYSAFDTANGGWEIGLGTWGTGNILTRTTVLKSSNANAAVSWAAGTREVFLTAYSAQINRSLQGAGNVANGVSSIVGGGTLNIASSSYAVVGGGYSNTASGYGSSVLGGAYSVANAQYSVASGFTSTASNQWATVCGGGNCTASGLYAAVGGGNYNLASGPYSTIPGGARASTFGIYGKYAYASGNFAGVGDGQLGNLTLRCATTNATATVLTSDQTTPVATNQLILQNYQMMTVRGQVACRRSVAQADQVAAFEFTATISRGVNAASTAIIGTPTVTSLANTITGLGATPFSLTADTTNGGLAITATGVAATNLRWLCVVNTAEVLYI